MYYSVRVETRECLDLETKQKNAINKTNLTEDPWPFLSPTSHHFKVVSKDIPLPISCLFTRFLLVWLIMLYQFCFRFEQLTNFLFIPSNNYGPIISNKMLLCEHLQVSGFLHTSPCLSQYTIVFYCA